MPNCHAAAFGHIKPLPLSSVLFSKPSIKYTRAASVPASARAGAAANDALSMPGGALFNGTRLFDERVWFLGAAVALPGSTLRFLAFFEVGLLYVYDDIPRYEVRSHSLMPLLSFKSRHVAASAGPHWRWTNFFGAATILEGQVALSLTVTPFIGDGWRAGAAVANFDEFYAGGLWDFYARVFFECRLREGLSLESSFSAYQSGLDGWTVSFYGCKVRSALRVSW
jgi:hypothetical protein